MNISTQRIKMNPVERLHAVSNGDEIGMIESFETLKSYNL